METIGYRRDYWSRLLETKQAREWTLRACRVSNQVSSVGTQLVPIRGDSGTDWVQGEK